MPAPSGPGMMTPPNAMQAPQAPPPAMPSPEDIAAARQHAGVIVHSLEKLVSKPRGDLTKKDVYDAASDMIANGAFPTAEMKQGLIVHLAGLPDDELSMRKALGQFLLDVSKTRSNIHAAWGGG